MTKSGDDRETHDGRGVLFAASNLDGRSEDDVSSARNPFRDGD